MAHYQFPSSPVNIRKVLDLSSLCPGASKYLGSADISLAADRFACITRHLNKWTQPTISLLDLKNLKKPVSISTIAIELGDPVSDRKAECKISPADGQWVVYYDIKRVWLQDLHPEPSSKPRLVTLNIRQPDIQVVKWIGDRTIVVITDDGHIYHVDAETGTAFLENIVHFVQPLEGRRIVDYYAAGKWSAISHIWFENGRSMGILNLYNEDNLSLEIYDPVKVSGFTGAFYHIDNVATQQDETVFIYADIGSDACSLSISAMQCLSTAPSVMTAKWKVDFRHPRSHDLKSADLPIAMHISQENGIIFVVTTLSYVHTFQMVDGKHLGSVRVSNYNISDSTLCTEQQSLLVADADGSIFKITVDVTGWTSLRNLSTINTAVARLAALRFAIRNEVPFTPALFSQFFPNLVREHSKAHQEAEELVGHLTGDELLTFWADVLKRNPLMMPVIRVMAKTHLEKIPIAELINLFKTHGGATGIFYFLNLIGSNKLTANELAEYIESAIKIQQFGALENAMLKVKVADPEAAKKLLKRKAKSDQIIALLFEKFCVRFDFVEDLIGCFLKKEVFRPGEIKKMIEQSDAGRVIRVFKALLESNIAEALLDAFLAVVNPTSFTPEFLTVLRKYNRLKSGVKCLEELVTESGSDASLVHLLMELYKENAETCELQKTAFFKRIGGVRCVEIGKMVQETDYQLALMVFKSGLCESCDYAYVTLAMEHSDYIDIAIYLLTRANEALWSYALLKSAHCETNILEAFSSDKLRVELVNCPFQSIMALMPALMEGNSSAPALLILRYLKDRQLDSKIERCFIQENTLKILVKWHNTDHISIMRFLNDNKDFHHVRMLTYLLENKIAGEAMIVISRLLRKEVAEEVTDADIASLTSLASTWDEKNTWIVVGNLQLERNKLHEAMLAYIRAQHCSNYADVWNAVKKEKDFGQWDTVVVYLKLAEKIMKDAKGLHAALSFALAKANRFDELEKLLENSADSGADDQKCRICEDAPKEVDFLPCHHVCACYNCAAQLTICPMCRGPITVKQRIYIS